MTTTPATRTTSTLTKVGAHLRARLSLRYVIAGAVLMALAITNLIATMDRGSAFTGNQIVQLGMAGIGTALVVTGIVKAARR